MRGGWLAIGYKDVMMAKHPTPEKECAIDGAKSLLESDFARVLEFIFDFLTTTS